MISLLARFDAATADGSEMMSAMNDEDPRQIFVAHPWGSSPEGGTFRDALRQIGQELDVNFVFPEEEAFVPKSLEENLSNAALSIFDLSHWNPNVAYEFGVANGLEVPAVALVRKSPDADPPPVPIQGFAEVRYSGFDELLDLLEPVIRRHIGSQASVPFSASYEEGPRQLGTTEEVLRLLRAGDDFELREFTASQREEFQSKLRSLLQLHSREDDLEGFDAALTPLLERYVGWLLPLVDHRSPLLGDELRVIGRFNGSRLLWNVPQKWATMNSWVTWWLVNSIGAFSLFTDNFKAIENLFWIPVEDENSPRRVLATVLPGRGGTAISELRLSQASGRRYWDPPFHYLTETLRSSPLFSSWKLGSAFAPETARWLGDFNFLSSLYAGKEHQPLTASWAGIEAGGEPVARRILHDPEFQEELARIFRVEPSTLLDSVPRWLEPIIALGVPGGLVSSEALAPWQAR